MKKKQVIKINNHFSFLEKQLSWILKARPCGVALRELLPLVRHLHGVFCNRGFEYGLTYIKSTRGNYLNALSGNPERFPLVKLTKAGIPVSFGPLLKYFSVQSSREITAKPAVLQLINTILFSTRALKGSPNPDVSPLYSPSKRGVLYPGIHILAKDFWKELGYHHLGVIPRALKFRRFHFTTKTGPNGHALGTWYYDLLALPEQLRNSIIILGGDRIKDFMSMALGLQSWTKELVWDGVRMLTGAVDPSDDGSGYIRRLTYFADKEGKTRVIAILDYFSQTVLRGLHIYLFKLLKKIPQDMTFDQGAFIEQVKDWPIYYSVDLSAATDRFPISLISQVLRGHLPASYVTAWEDVMVGYPFVFHNRVPGLPTSYDEDGGLRYSVGNPMGAYSSWASFAVAHHYIFYFISRLLNKEFKTLRYVLLGDDVLIGDEEAAKLYLEIIRDLGVDVSLAKTHVSKHTFEFAKRWSHRGHEISPFPISALKQCGKKYYFLTALLMVLEGKGWVWESGISQVVSDFYCTVVQRPSRFRKSIERKSYTTEQIMRIIWGSSPADCMNNIVRKLGHTDIYFNDSMALQMLSNIAVDLFSRSMPDSKSGKPLGLIAEELVLFITGKLEECPEAMTLLECPTLHAYGSIEQRYIDLLNMSRDIDLNRQGEWPLLLRAMTIPLSDDLFIDRQEQTTALGVSQIGRLLTDRIGLVRKYPNLMDIEQSMYPEPEGKTSDSGILDPLTSTKEEVQKVTGLTPRQQLDPSNFINLEFSHKRSEKLPKPGSRLFKSALSKLDRATYKSEWLWSLLGFDAPNFRDAKSGTSPKGKGPTGKHYSKVSWLMKDRNRRLVTWLERHDPQMLETFFSVTKESLIAFVNEQADAYYKEKGIKEFWSQEKRLARLQKPCSNRRWLWIERAIWARILKQYGPVRGSLVIAGSWILLLPRRFFAYLKERIR